MSAVSWYPSSGFSLDLEGEGGFASLPISANGSGISEPALRGAWYGVQFGVGVALEKSTRRKYGESELAVSSSSISLH
jgi:hypothetical protein